MAFILDDILFSPLKLTIWLGEKLRDAAYNEMTDESKIHEGLLHQAVLGIEFIDATIDDLQRDVLGQ